MTSFYGDFKVCVCEYYGTNYCGWQFQGNASSIQQAIEYALFQLYSENIRILGSGRTDSGVHAIGQVFTYRAIGRRSNKSILMALNTFLPEDISLVSVNDADEGFHPIASAESKTYLYRILNRFPRSALEHRRAWHYKKPLNEKLMLDILEPLNGTHDFSSFCMVRSLKEDNKRTVNFINVSRSGEIIELRINANGFLHNMMRIITGTAVILTAAGGSEMDMRAVLNKCKRDPAFKTAPAHGLYLEKVYYSSFCVI